MIIMGLRDNKEKHLYGILCETAISSLAVKIALCDSLQLPVTFISEEDKSDKDRFSLDSKIIVGDYGIDIEYSYFQEENTEMINDYKIEIALQYLKAFKQFYRFEPLSDTNAELTLHKEDVKATEEQIKKLIENKDKKEKEAKLDELKRIYTKLEEPDKNKFLAKIIINGGL